MNKFFVPNEIYEERMSICKSCVFYFKPTGTCKDCGCFMKIKSRLATMSCSQRKWLKTTETINAPKDLPQEIINEILDIWKDLKTGVAKDVATKKRMIVKITNTNNWYKKGEKHEVGCYITLKFSDGHPCYEKKIGHYGICIDDCKVIKILN